MVAAAPPVAEDVGLDDEVIDEPVVGGDEERAPDPSWLWVRLRTRRPDREVWERMFADHAPHDGLDYRAAHGNVPEEHRERGDDVQGVVLRAVERIANSGVPVEKVPEIMTVEETAALLRINEKTAYEKVRRGEIPGGKHIGGVVRVSRAVLLESFRSPNAPKKSRRSR